MGEDEEDDGGGGRERQRPRGMNRNGHKKSRVRLQGDRRKTLHRLWLQQYFIFFTSSMSFSFCRNAMKKGFPCLPQIIVLAHACKHTRAHIFSKHQLNLQMCKMLVSFKIQTCHRASCADQWGVSWRRDRTIRPSWCHKDSQSVVFLHLHWPFSRPRPPC